MDSVRGFVERQFAGDRGYSGTFEIYSPDLGSQFGINPQVFEPGVIGISSAGLGIRIGYKSNLSARLDYGSVIKNGGAGDPGQGRASFNLVWVF